MEPDFYRFIGIVVAVSVACFLLAGGFLVYFWRALERESKNPDEVTERPSPVPMLIALVVALLFVAGFLAWLVHR